MFALCDLHPREAFDAVDLWDRERIEQTYRNHIKALADSTRRLSGRDDEQAAKEILLLGRVVTRDILLDPLLPDALVDTHLRQQMVNDMRGYDRWGRPFWRALYDAYH